MPRCINWASQHGQKTRNNFLADHFSFLLLPCRVRCPKVAKNGLLERWRALFSIAIGHLGAPSSQRRQRPSKAARTPIEHDERSSSMWRSANPSKGAKASITRSVIPPSVSRAVQCRRSDRTAKNGEIACLMIRPKVADGDRKRALQRSKSPFLTTFGHLTRPIPQKNEK